MAPPPGGAVGTRPVGSPRASLRHPPPPRRRTPAVVARHPVRAPAGVARSPAPRVLELDSGAIVIAPVERADRARRALDRPRGARPRLRPRHGRRRAAGSRPLPDGAVGRRPDVRASPSGSAWPRRPRSSRPRRSTTSSACASSTPSPIQPIVELAGGGLHEYECLFRPNMPMLPQSISSIVQAAIDTDRSIELDVFLIATILERTGEIDKRRRANGARPAPRRGQRDAAEPARRALRGARLRGDGPRCRARSAQRHPRMHRAAGRRRRRPAPEGRQGPAPRRLRVRRRRCGCRLCELRAHRRPATHGHQDRPRHRRGHRARRRQAGARRGVRVVRSADRRPPAGRGHREALRPRDGDRARRRPRPGLSPGATGDGTGARRGTWRSSGRWPRGACARVGGRACPRQPDRRTRRGAHAAD